MFNLIQHALNSHTVRKSAITGITTFLSAGFGAVFYLVVARGIGAERYSLFSTGLNIIMIVSSIADLGMTSSIVRFVAANKGTSESAKYAAVALRTKIFTGAISILLLTLFAVPIAKGIFNQELLIPLMPIIGLGVISQIFFTFTTSVFQGEQKYMLWGGLQVGSNIFRLMVMLVLLTVGLIDAKFALLLFGISFLGGFIISWKWLDPHIFTTKISRHHWQEFWHFNRWTAAFTMLAAIVSRLDVVLTSRYLTTKEAGPYYLAQTMVAFLPQLAGALGAVTSTKFAGLSSQNDVDHYLKKSLPFSLLVGVGASLFMIPAALGVIWFTGKSEYGPALSPFLALLIGMAIFISLNPVRDCILYYYKKPQFFFWATILQGVVMLVLGSLLIPQYKTIGSALTIICGNLSLAGASIFYILKLRR